MGGVPFDYGTLHVPHVQMLMGHNAYGAQVGSNALAKSKIKRHNTLVLQPEKQ